MKKLTVWTILMVLVILGSLTSCVSQGSAGVSAQLKPWFDFACDTYEEARPVVIALLDAAAEHPEVVPEKYRDAVNKFRDETAPKLDRGLRILCAAKNGEPVQQVIKSERSKPDWGAIALQTARIATLALQLRADGKI